MVATKNLQNQTRATPQVDVVVLPVLPAEARSARTAQPIARHARACVARLIDVLALPRSQVAVVETPMVAALRPRARVFV